MSGGGSEHASRSGGIGYRAPGRIRLVPLEPEVPEPGLIGWLAAELGRVLATDVAVDSPLAASAEWWSRERGQLNSDRIVDGLVGRYPAEAGAPHEWVLAITAADLRGGGRDFVFGEAAMGGAWAVIGTARLGAPGEPRYRRRVLTEALHELGHLAGLEHCASPRCLMAASRNVKALDEKGPMLCLQCREKNPDTEP